MVSYVRPRSQSTVRHVLQGPPSFSKPGRKRGIDAVEDSKPVQVGDQQALVLKRPTLLGSPAAVSRRSKIPPALAVAADPFAGPEKPTWLRLHGEKHSFYASRALTQQERSAAAAFLKSQGKTVLVVDLREDEDEPGFCLRASDEAREWQGCGFETLHHPVGNKKLPTLENFIKLIGDLKVRIKKGDAVWIHCQGGKGRTGAVALALDAVLHASKDLDALQAQHIQEGAKAQLFSPKKSPAKAQAAARRIAQLKTVIEQLRQHFGPSASTGALR